MATKDIMIDIETLSLDSDALILSVGAIEFDCTGTEGPFFGDQFFSTPSIIEQLLMGRSVSRGTQEFWKKQPRHASDHWAGPAVVTVKVADMLTGLAVFVDGAPRIWANGIVFDIGILESLYKHFNTDPPWKYNAIRDARTVYDVMPECRHINSATMQEQIAHHPLGDCRTQIIRLWEHGHGCYK